jgi:hypothetical protein
MKLARTFIFLCLSVWATAYSFDSKEANETLPEMPFKKSLTLTSVLLFDAPHKDVDSVAQLTSKLSNYAILEAQAEKVVEPLRDARKRLKKIIADTTFKNEQDLNNVFDQIKKETDQIAAHNLEEMQRDRLIKFNENGKPVLGSKQYEVLLQAAKEYQKQQLELQKHPLFSQLQTARKELKPLMYAFLKQNYPSVQQIQEAFNEPIKKVNIFLNAMPMDKK